MNDGTVSNSYVTGSITVTRGDLGGTSNVGGLVGENSGGGTITASYATAAVTVNMGSPNAGGLVGVNTASIAASYATGAVSATASENAAANAGGLVGSSSGTIMASYATGDASAEAPPLGTPVATPTRADWSGWQWRRTITASYSTGAPPRPHTASTPTGNSGTVTITASYSTGRTETGPIRAAVNAKCSQQLLGHRYLWDSGHDTRDHRCGLPAPSRCRPPPATARAPFPPTISSAAWDLDIRPNHQHSRRPVGLRRQLAVPGAAVRRPRTRRSAARPGQR